MISRYAFVEEARSWLGTPDHHQAHLKGVGADCIGYLVGVVDNFGLPEAAAWFADQRFSGYSRTPNPELLLQACDIYLDRIEPMFADVADILVLRFSGQPHHFAIVSSMDPMYMLHSKVKMGVVENRVDERWQQRIMRAYHVRGVE